MELLDLFVVALIPVLKVLIITCVGLFLALDSIDLLGPNARHRLNNLVFFVFSPAFVASHLAETITFESLVKLWFMPVNILLTFIIGSALAWILIKITKTPTHLQGIVIGCCSAGNLGNLLLIIVPAVCSEANNPFGDSKLCSTYGEAYASLSMAVGAVYIWTYVHLVMRIYADKNAGDSQREPLLPSRDNSVTAISDNDDYSSIIQLEPTKAPFVGKTIECLKKLTRRINLKMVFAPATIGAIVGFVIGTVSPIRRLMVGDNAPLRVIYSSASLIGDALIPCMTLIVGANLYKGLKRSGVGIPLILGILIVRYILLPVMGIGVLKFAQHFGMVGSDSLYQFILLLQYALPPAMTIGVMAQLFETGESECSVIMLWTYVVAAFALTLWSTFYMWLLE